MSAADPFPCICDPTVLFDPPNPIPVAVEGCPAHWVRRTFQQVQLRIGSTERRICGTEREPDGEQCLGWLTFEPFEVQAKCPECGAWTGRLWYARGGPITADPPEGGRAFLHGADADPPGEHVDGCDWPAGNCWGHPNEERTEDELVAVVVNGDRELAERICGLLNAPTPDVPYISGAREALAEVRRRLDTAANPEEQLFAATVRQMLRDAAAEVGVPADSCTGCTAAKGDPACPVHEGRRPKGPKPPPLGAGCICDGSGRACPRHGEVI